MTRGSGFVILLAAGLTVLLGVVPWPLLNVLHYVL
jgi:hypothetical protein